MIDSSFRRKNQRKFGWRFSVWAILFHIGVVGALILWEIHYQKQLIRDEIKKMLEVHTLSNADLQKLMSRARVVDTEFAAEKDREKVADQKAYRGEKTQRVKTETIANKFGSSRGRDESFSAPRMSTPGSAPKPAPGEIGRELKPSEKSKLQKGTFEFVDPAIKVSDMTLLNTNEYIRAGFENRMREEIAAIWVPRVKELQRSGKVVLDIGIYVTTTRVFINPDGSVPVVTVEKSSGFPLLDKEGPNAIMQVRAFPNPPKELFAPPFNGSFEFIFIVRITPAKRLNFNVIFDDRLQKGRNYNPFHNPPAHRSPR